jgi:hypothetical protein
MHGGSSGGGGCGAKAICSSLRVLRSTCISRRSTKCVRNLQLNLCPRIACPLAAQGRVLAGGACPLPVAGSPDSTTLRDSIDAVILFRAADAKDASE